MNFRDFAVERGFDLDLHHLDGTLHRFNRKGKNKDNAWVIGWRHEKDFIIALFGDWSESISYRFKSHDIFPQDIAKKLEVKELEYKQEKRKRQLRAASLAVRTIDDALEISSNHPYITAKQIKPQHVIVDKNNNILVPMIIGDRVVGIQRIWPDGTKKFMTDSEVRGAYHIVKFQKSGNIYICEGWATGHTIAMATAGTVVCAFSANNLKNVAQELRRRHPRREIIICADNDQFTDGNPGIEYAKKAAKAVGGWVVYPQFQYLRGRPTDFNDLMIQEDIETVKDNVFYFKKEKQTESKSKDNFMFDVYSAVARVAAGDLPEFEKRFYLVEFLDGIKVLREGDKSVVEYVADEILTSEIAKYCLNNRDRYRVRKPREFREITDYFRLNAKPIKEPPVIGDYGDQHLCFHRLPWRIEEMPTPLFDELLSRCDNADALCAFIGSIFDLGSDRQQYLYLYGSGGNGKGATIRFLDRLLGPAVVSREPPRSNDKFWNYGLLGKRLCMFADCDDYKFVSSQKFKMLSGGDPIPMERKGENEFKAKINCKFIFASNEVPGISSQASDMRRAIFVDMDKFDGDAEGDYEDRLWLEGAGIIDKCKKAYERMCVKGGPIENDKEQLEIIAEQNVEPFDQLLDKYFHLDAAYLKDESTKKQEDVCWTTGMDFAAWWDIYIKKPESHRREFIKHIKITKGIRKRVVRLEDGKFRKCYVGMRLKPRFAICLEMHYGGIPE